MNRYNLNEAPCLEHVFELTRNLIRSPSKDAGKMVASLFRSSKYLSPFLLHSAFKRDQIENGALLLYLVWSCPVLNRIQKRLRGLVGDDTFSNPQSLWHMQNVAIFSLFQWEIF